MRTVDILLARFPFGAREHPEAADWMTGTVLKAKCDPRIGMVHKMKVDDTPITMSRNRVMKQAVALGADLVLMLDSDMIPDLPLPGARPFWDTSLDFVLSHPGPCCVAAPYCGPSPHENVYVFRWARLQSDHPNTDMQIQQFSREEAALCGGFAECAALATGLILIDVRALDKIGPPYFEYEYADPPWNTQKSTTEDCYFTRNLSLAGVPQYVNWDAWAGHYKGKVVGKPTLLYTNQIREAHREAILRNTLSNERLIDVSERNGFGRLPTRISPAPSPLEDEDDVLSEP